MVPSGSQATITWNSLNGNRAYKWYAVADNSGAASVSPRLDLHHKTIIPVILSPF
jgi:hypothetical protein